MGHILAGIKSNNLPAIITFIDFRKASDIIHSSKMLKILRECGIHNLIVEAVGKMYEDIRAKVISPDGEIDLAF